MPERNFDVIIAGTGIFGTTLGSVLSHRGLKVLLLERGQHPRFALGEALLPQSAIWPFVIAKRFGVEAIEHLSHADRIVDHVTQTCGLKHSIGFAWHQSEETVDSAHVHQLVPPHLPFYSESHLYRQDVDHYLLKAAQSYGCHYHDLSDIQSVSWSDDSISVQTQKTTFNAALLIDASGRNSSLVKQEGCRDDEPRTETWSRCIFSHVEGLPAIDHWLTADSAGRRLHDGTFHHVFDGGWLWVIPFDNFHRSTSSLASVGLMLDPRIYPEDRNLGPSDEFFSIVNRFPTMRAHLANITPARPFVRTERLQYTSKTSVGKRYILGPSTYGFVDPLYSNGLVHTFESVFKIAECVLADLSGHQGEMPDLSQRSKQAIHALHEAQLLDSDRMVSSAYRAMANPKTWSAWTQAWLAQVLFSDLWLQRACFRYFESGSKTAFDDLLSGVRPGGGSPFNHRRELLLDDLHAILSKNDGTQTSHHMLERLRQEDWLPRHVYDWGNPNARSIDFSRPDIAGTLLTWGFEESPEFIRSGLFDFTLPSPP